MATYCESQSLAFGTVTHFATNKVPLHLVSTLASKLELGFRLVHITLGRVLLFLINLCTQMG